jgi:hypothetical protein
MIDPTSQNQQPGELALAEREGCSACRPPTKAIRQIVIAGALAVPGT